MSTMMADLNKSLRAGNGIVCVSNLLQVAKDVDNSDTNALNIRGGKQAVKRKVLDEDVVVVDSVQRLLQAGIGVKTKRT